MPLAPSRAMPHPDTRPLPVPEAARHGARETLLLRGAGVLSDAELLGVLLGTGATGVPVEQLAQGTLRDLGGLVGLAQARPGELAQRLGIGPTKAARLVAAVELGRRTATAPLRCGQRLANSRAVFEAFGPGLRHARSEQFWAVALDVRHRIRALIPVAQGSLSACPVAPADVFRPLIREGAAATLVLHNHPSGDPSPSPEDELLTRVLARAGALIGIQVLDHVIVGHDNYYSFLDNGALESDPPEAF